MHPVCFFNLELYSYFKFLCKKSYTRVYDFLQRNLELYSYFKFLCKKSYTRV